MTPKEQLEQFQAFLDDLLKRYPAVLNSEVEDRNHYFQITSPSTPATAKICKAACNICKLLFHYLDERSAGKSKNEILPHFSQAPISDSMAALEAVLKGNKYTPEDYEIFQFISKLFSFAGGCQWVYNKTEIKNLLEIPPDLAWYEKPVINPKFENFKTLQAGIQKYLNDHVSAHEASQPKSPVSPEAQETKQTLEALLKDRENHGIRISELKLQLSEVISKPENRENFTPALTLLGQIKQELDLETVKLSNAIVAFGRSEEEIVQEEKSLLQNYEKNNTELGATEVFQTSLTELPEYDFKMAQSLELTAQETQQWQAALATQNESWASPLSWYQKTKEAALSFAQTVTPAFLGQPRPSSQVILDNLRAKTASKIAKLEARASDLEDQILKLQTNKDFIVARKENETRSAQIGALIQSPTLDKIKDLLPELSNYIQKHSSFTGRVKAWFMGDRVYNQEKIAFAIKIKSSLMSVTTNANVLSGHSPIEHLLKERVNTLANERKDQIQQKRIDNWATKKLRKEGELDKVLSDLSELVKTVDAESPVHTPPSKT